METISNLNSLISLLVVEDDDESREILVAILSRKFSHATVYSAHNGKCGMDLFEIHMPDIVITDINMPEMSGVQMAGKIRAIRPGTKLIVLTADTGKATLEDSVGSGLEVDHYILKPVDFGELLTAIEQCIAETSPHQSH